ncbi:penicillin-binding transpeptidase domain-containing protein [Phytohabitans sp. ZYX-F-186]|uniref:Penicillin-binding transpeptidase domain-containing protein n=1 Tax=Phytohabitans maris TaxID=3071409 RepID=A0ABU0ZUJ6_9ACTN|nr:penicillin-binding transpeptidase domain-containing protein [Phytohabitans sp. ZYX-F-186]MDQ7909845.1 penicillin-binding transpeptidase domain-containing protein [Phytohabitans sp. ZYX-F-186]
MRVTYGVAAIVLAAGVLTACGSDDGPEKSVDAFLSGWRSGNLDAVGFIDPGGQKIPAADVVTEIKALSGELAATPPALAVEGEPSITENIATSTVKVDWTLPGGAHWTYPTTVRLNKGSDDKWQVIWEPKIVQEKLTAGDEFAIERETADRAPILDAAGKPIVESRPVVVVGVEPGKVAGMQQLVKDLDAAFKSVGVEVGLADLPARAAAADPTHFVEVVTLRKEVYLKIRQRLQDLPGTHYREETRYLAPTREFARALLGTVDPVQKEDIDNNPGKYVVGDVVGHGGLQERYDDQLRGGVGQIVKIVRKTGEGTEKTTEEVAEVFRAEPKPGAPLKTTLDTKIQQAADGALRGVGGGTPRTAALVAVRVHDGTVAAVANTGDVNLAFNASVPPGSTFKMVSALALLDKGAVTLDTKVNCPKNATVDGRSYKNSHDMALGSVPFRVDFARSCNTAFIGLAPKLGDDGLATAGRSLGLEGTWNLGVDAFSGKVSTGGSATERASASFGQGTTVVSPLAMAAATAAVARGQWQQPTILTEPAPAQKAAPGPELNAGSAEAVRTMMREVVTSGTGSALKDVPGQPVYGKTGTAEFDNNPANTHAWWVGWQGDIAFAVFVEKGGDSGTSSVPVAEKFLRGLR